MATMAEKIEKVMLERGVKPTEQSIAWAEGGQSGTWKMICRSQAYAMEQLSKKHPNAEIFTFSSDEEGAIRRSIQLAERQRRQARRQAWQY